LGQWPSQERERAHALRAQGHTIAQIAQTMGMPETAVRERLRPRQGGRDGTDWSVRRRQIQQHLSQGHSPQEIAQALAVAVPTIQRYILRISREQPSTSGPIGN
jgi:DNA-binding CsgD family transcriptional regulator